MSLKLLLSQDDFLPGNIEYQDIELDLEQSVKDQIDMLKEDLLHVSYPSGLLLDVGWYPSFDEDGAFHVKVIQNYNWDEPCFHAEFTEIENLKKTIFRAAKYCAESKEK